MKTTKRLWPFVLADNKLAEEYLEQQAAKGLLLERIGNFGILATYSCVEPQERQFCIDGFKGKKEEQGRYLRIAKDAGWDYVTEQPGHIFFVNREGETPVPMQTDWREEYLQIRKGFWKQDIPLGIFASILLLLLAWLWKVLEIEGGLPMDWRSLYSYACFIFVLIGFAKAIWFYLKSEFALRRDVPMNLGTMKSAMAWGYGRVVIGILWLLGVWCNGATILMKDFKTGINPVSIAAVVMICCLIVFIIIGIRLTKTDELGRKVFKNDDRSKRLLILSGGCLVISFAIYMIVTF